VPSTERILADLVLRVESQYFGKYRGLVVDNADPEHLGRLRVQVPSVLGPDVATGWALPCVPYGGDAGQGLLFVPARGAGVWVEFEEGDLEFPIWVGSFWSDPGSGSEAPRPNRPDGSEEAAVADQPTRKIIKTAKGHTVQFEDADGEESLTVVEGKHGHVIRLDADGIKLTDGASGNQVVLDSAGIRLADGHDNAVILRDGGIQLGSAGAVEALVHGTTLKTNVTAFLMALSTHTHIAPPFGGPTSQPPPGSFTLDVPLSNKHKVE